MKYIERKAPFVKAKDSTTSIMLKLMIGLGIVYLFGLYNASRYGMNFVVNALLLLVVSLATSVLIEIIYCVIFKQNIVSYIKKSYSYVTSLILVLIVPVNTKFYVIAIASAIATLSKLVFGGFGDNLINPAALGRFVILMLFTGKVAFDGIAQPTITTRMSILNWVMDTSTLNRVLKAYGGLDSVLVGTYFGAMGETCTLIILLVGVALAFMNVIDFIIPLTYLGELFIGGVVVALVKGISILYPISLIATGAAAFGAVFMLTDPVTAPITRAGKIVYASLAAILTIFFRFYTGYPEGVVLSILIVNVLKIAINLLFVGKQLNHITRNVVISFVSILVAICFIGASGIIKTNGEIVDRNNKEDKPNSNVTMYKFDADYPENKVEVVKDGDIYHCKAKGYHGINEYDIEIKDGKVTSAIVIAFNDTVGMGDMATNDEGYLNDFVGKGLSDQIDAYAGATKTSESLIAAVSAALKEAGK